MKIENHSKAFHFCQVHIMSNVNSAVCFRRKVNFSCVLMLRFQTTTFSLSGILVICMLYAAKCSCLVLIQEKLKKINVRFSLSMNVVLVVLWSISPHFSVRMWGVHAACTLKLSPISSEGWQINNRRLEWLTFTVTSEFPYREIKLEMMGVFKEIVWIGGVWRRDWVWGIEEHGSGRSWG